MQKCIDRRFDFMFLLGLEKEKPASRNVNAGLLLIGQGPGCICLYLANNLAYNSVKGNFGL